MYVLSNNSRNKCKIMATLSHDIELKDWVNAVSFIAWLEIKPIYTTINLHDMLVAIQEYQLSKKVVHTCIFLS